MPAPGHIPIDVKFAVGPGMTIIIMLPVVVCAGTPLSVPASKIEFYPTLLDCPTKIPLYIPGFPGTLERAIKPVPLAIPVMVVV